MATNTIELPDATAQRIRERASQLGKTVENYITGIVDRDLAISDTAPANRRCSFEELTAPIANAVRQSGMTDDEVGDFVEEIVEEVRAERYAKKTAGQ